MASGLGELFIELGTIGDTKELEKFVKKVREGAEAIEKQMKAQDKQSNSLKKTVKGFTAVVGAITAAAYALNRLTNDLVRNNQAFLNLTRQSDIALSSFQKWDGIGKMFGIENAAGQLENLNEKLFELRLTGEGARGFQLAGINPIGQDAQGVLEQLRSRIQGMDNTTASYLLKQMGLDPRMITLLRMDRQEFEELGATIRKYQLTDKQRQQIEKMNIQLQIASQKLQYLKDRAILAIMPYWVKFVQSLARVAEGLARVTKWLTTTKGGIVTLATVITGTLIPAIRTLYAVITSHPIVAIITAIAGALYLLIDDIMAFYQGGASGIGYLLYFFDELDNKINFETPKWITDLLALAQSAGNLLEMADSLNKIAHGEKVQVSSSRIINKAVGNIPGMIPGVNLGFLKNSGDISKAAKLGASFGIWLKDKFTNLSDDKNLSSTFITPAMTQSIDNSNAISNANTTIAMTNYIETEQPAQSIDRELRFTMASYA